MILFKKLKMFQLFILGKIGNENVFDDILYTKKAFKTISKIGQENVFHDILER